jgi:DNA-binding response OmpR family regulator
MQDARMNTNMRVALLLEDEPLIALDLEQILRGADFDVTPLASSSEALEWLTVSRPDLVIVDIILRDGTSETVVQQLADDRIPFIVHSGDPASLHAGTVFSRGTWLTKPASADDLIRTARALAP